jgi:hypothetical protein
MTSGNIPDLRNLTIESVQKVVEDFKQKNPRGYAETALLAELRRFPTHVIDRLRQCAERGLFDGLISMEDK